MSEPLTPSAAHLARLAPPDKAGSHLRTFIRYVGWHYGLADAARNFHPEVAKLTF